uniref:Ribosomal L1 domain-containing protein 1 n=1 Tax=Lygus hesperus TaxID=30085 RepID=A0A0K8S7U8_LYGHE
MKTPKTLKEKETTLGKAAGGKITKNKAKGKNLPGNQIDAAKAKLGLQKAKDTVKVQDGKNVQKKGGMKNKVFNGQGSPLNGSGGKKRKSDEGVKPDVKKGKGAAVVKSPEVQLGLKIEKMLESPKNKKKNKKKGKKNATDAGATPEVQTPVAGSPGQGKNKRKRDRKRKHSEGSSPVASKPAENQQKKIKQPAAPKPIVDKSEYDTPVPMGSFPSRVNAENAIKALLKHMKEYKAKKSALLDDYEPLLVCVDFFKRPEGARKIQRVVLPHHLLGNNPEIIVVVGDDKKAKKDYEESIEKHKELFKSNGIDNISEIIPWRKLCDEYTQFEEKRKLANRADAFLIDSRLSHRWPSIMRKKFFKKKAPIPLRIYKANDLKKNVEIALRRIAIILGGHSLSVSPQFGHSKMNVKSLSDNLITIATVLCDQTKYPGGQGNIRQITIRGSKTEGFPVFVSTASPNTVEIPKVAKKKRAAVEGEVTTAGVTVRVHPSGHVQIKSKDKDDDEEEGNTSPKKKTVRNEEDSDEDDSEAEDDDDDDSEIDADLLDKFKKANKASEDESSEDEEEIEKAEQEFLLALRKQQDALESEALAKNKKAGKKVPVAKEESSDEDDDDDDEDLDDEDDSDVPDLIPAKKSKVQTQPAKKGKNAKQAPGGAKPAQNGVGKGKPNKGKPGKQAQSPKGAKKGFQGGKGNANQKGNNKGSPKAQQKSFNKGGKKK